MNDNALIQLTQAQHALAECKTVMEAKQIADVAEAARVYAFRFFQTDSGRLRVS